MTRAERMISIGLLVTAIYLAAFFGLLPILPAKIQNEVVPVLPFWALVSFGAYMLSSMGWNLLVFNDVPAAHASLMKEIDQAKKELRQKGVDVD